MTISTENVLFKHYFWSQKTGFFFAESESQQLQQLPAKNLTDFSIAQETALSAEIPFENIILNWLGIDYYFQKE